MASIPSNGYREVMAGSNVYTGSNLYGSLCPQTPITPVLPIDLTNKLYVDTIVGGGSVVSVTGGTNITVAPTTVAPVVSLQSPLTAELNVGTQSLRDTAGAVGTSGQVLTAGTGGQVLWGSAGGGGTLTGIGAGLNIGIDNTVPAVPVVRLLAPLTSALDVGTQDIISSTSAIDITPLAGQDCNVNVSGAGGLHTVQSSAGGAANPLARFVNTNAATGGVNVDLYKNRTGATNDIVSALNFYGKDNAGTKTQFGGIESVITSAGGGGGVDGALDFYSCVNGAKSLVFRMNGADNENNTFRPLDLNGNALKTSSGNLTVDANASSGTGNINLNPKAIPGNYVAINSTGASNLRLDGTINNLAAPTKNTIDMEPNPSALIPINGFTINRDLVKLEYQQAVSNDVSVISLTNSPTAISNQIEASYLTSATGALQQTLISTTPASHSIQLLDPTAGRTTKIFSSKIELDEGGSDIIIDASAFTSGVQISGGGDDGVEGGSFALSAVAGTQEFRLVGTDIATSLTKTLQIDNNTAGDGVISYTNNTGDGAELQITSNTDISIGTIGGTGNSVFLNGLNEATVSCGNQMSLKVFNANQPITFEVANTGGFLNFVGTGLQSATSSGTATQFLAITLNGTQYKIPLDLP